MKAISLDQPQQFRQIEVPEPDAPGAGEVLVRVLRIGICGTDYSGYLGKMPFFSYPRIPGHELGVEVLALGAGVEHLHPGDRCSVEPYMNCQQCFACRRGNGNCCENLKVIGVMSDGGMRERIILPARKITPRTHSLPSNARWSRRSPSAATPWIAAIPSRGKTCSSSARVRSA